VHGRDVTSRAELALDANGRVLALRVRSWANVGAYPAPGRLVIQLLIGPWVVDQHLRHAARSACT
jgi:carbon-monoxide dehydrogenase large subunit